MRLSWEYKKINNPQSVIVQSEEEAWEIKAFLLRRCSELKARNFKLDNYGGDKNGHSNL